MARGLSTRKMLSYLKYYFLIAGEEIIFLEEDDATLDQPVNSGVTVLLLSTQILL